MLAGRLSLNPLRHLDPVGSIILPLILKLTGSPVIFGYAKPVPVNFANLHDLRNGTLYVASAGCVANLALVFLSGFFFRILIKFGPIWYDSFFRPVVMDLFLMLGYSVLINSVLAIFNLIPIPPLDGSGVLSGILSDEAAQKYDMIRPYGFLILMLLIMTGFIGRILYAIQRIIDIFIF